ncbi:hypothetical protein K439DRAFT_1256835, partial [Ramaria rubella]
VEHVTKEVQETARQAEKDTAEHAHVLQCTQNAVLKTYNAPLTSYKCKDDLKDIAATFALAQTGTIPELLARCQEHLAHNPHLQVNTRFTGLF